MAAKHFMIYYQRGTGTYVVTEPRPWARENKKYFQNFTFIKSDHPTTNEIEDWLIDNKNFQKVIDTSDIVVIQNLDPKLIL